MFEDQQKLGYPNSKPRMNGFDGTLGAWMLNRKTDEMSPEAVRLSHDSRYNIRRRFRVQKQVPIDVSQLYRGYSFHQMGTRVIMDSRAHCSTMHQLISTATLGL
jgi:hypothetical protein